jgi:GntR family transcriptional regulator, transcriptional repressor for pyruvate dehydrogenase complex
VVSRIAGGILAVLIEKQLVQERFPLGQARKNRLSEQVADHIRALIIEKGLQPGAKLATEAQLAAQMGVSRTVVREAVKTLEEWRIVRTVTGKGLFVTQMDVQFVSDAFRLLVNQSPTPLIHLMEIRRMLEIEVAGLAAERATAEDLAVLGQTYQLMLERLAEATGRYASIERYVDAEIEFHTVLAAAAHNPLLLVMLEPIADLLRQMRRATVTGPGAHDEDLEDHRQILDQVRARNRNGARSKMREHLIHAETRFAIAEARTAPDGGNG